MKLVDKGLATQSAMQVVVDLFIKSGQPPPEDHAAAHIPAPEPEPEVVLYSLWKQPPD